jgi:hypothetical protein
MPINDIAQNHLDALINRLPFPGGIAFRKELDSANLNFTMPSLARVDALLDGIRTRSRPNFDDFVEREDNQNFLHALCFYTGATVALSSKQSVDWYTYDEITALMPDVATMFPSCFATHICCLLSRGGFFIPLSAIQERLFDEPPGKSVKFSAEMFVK